MIPMLEKDSNGNYIQGKGSDYGFNTLAAVLTKGITTPAKVSMVKEILRSFMEGNEPDVEAFDFNFGETNKKTPEPKGDAQDLLANILKQIDNDKQLGIN